MSNEVTKTKLKYTGVVSKISAEKTIKVRIEFKYKHPKYGKIVKSHKNVLVHVDDEKIFKVGDKINIEVGRKVSKNKSFVISNN